MIVSLQKAKAELAELVERAKAGEEIIIAEDGEPSVRLNPVDAAPRLPRGLGALKGKVPPLPDSFFFDPLPEDVLKDFEGGDESAS